MFVEVTLSLFEGFGKTLLIFALTLAFSVPLGLLVCFGSMSKLGFTVGGKKICPVCSPSFSMKNWEPWQQKWKEYALWQTLSAKNWEW